MKCLAAPLTAIRPWSLAASPFITLLPNSYDGEKPPYAWNVAMFTLVDSRRMIGERNGTNGSWEWSRSKRSRSSMSRTWETQRGERVIVPNEALTRIQEAL